ncbi:MAG: ABC transporter permease [Planctomycetota bacterium]|jgi:iron(III) transport system permease protein
MMRRLPLSLWLALALFAVLALLPIGLMGLESLVIQTFSIGDAPPAPPSQVGGAEAVGPSQVDGDGVLAGPSLDAYRNILGTETERTQLWNTVLLGFWATFFSVLLGSGTAWLCHRTDLPLGRVLGLSGLLPILFPPILVAMAFADLTEARGFAAIGLVLAASHLPFTLALTARGLRSVDGRLYEAALLSRGRLRAELTLLRQVLPDILAGALLVLVFVMSEHGVPEFLSVKGKPWRVYSEAIFLNWPAPGLPGSLRSAQATAFSLPLVVLTLAFAWLCLRARHKGSLVTLCSDFRPLPVRRLGRWRAPALLFCLIPVSIGLLIPVWRMLMWTAGSTANKGMSLDNSRESFQAAWGEWADELLYSNGVAIAVAAVLVALGSVLAWHAARGKRNWIEGLTMITLAVPALLLGIGFIRLWNRPGSPLGMLYETPVMVVLAYATRFLPLAVLGLANAFRRLPPEFEEAALLTGRSRPSRIRVVLLPLALPAMASVAILGFLLSLRELDLAVLLFEGNRMAVRPISNSVHFGYEDRAAAFALLLLLCAALPLIARLLLTGKTGEATT